MQRNVPVLTNRASRSTLRVSTWPEHSRYGVVLYFSTVAHKFVPDSVDVLSFRSRYRHTLRALWMLSSVDRRLAQTLQQWCNQYRRLVRTLMVRPLVLWHSGHELKVLTVASEDGDTSQERVLSGGSLSSSIHPLERARRRSVMITR